MQVRNRIMDRRGNSLPIDKSNHESVIKSSVKYFTPQTHNRIGIVDKYKPQPSSRLYDIEYQTIGLQGFFDEIQKYRDGKIKDKLVTKMMQTLGLTKLPASDSIHPFFHLSDHGEINISFLYDCPPNSPWSMYLLELFPSKLLRLNREIYEFLTKPDFTPRKQNFLEPVQRKQLINKPCNRVQEKEYDEEFDEEYDQEYPEEYDEEYDDEEDEEAEKQLYDEEFDEEQSHLDEEIYEDHEADSEDFYSAENGENGDMNSSELDDDSDYDRNWSESPQRNAQQHFTKSRNVTPILHGNYSNGNRKSPKVVTFKRNPLNSYSADQASFQDDSRETWGMKPMKRTLTPKHLSPKRRRIVRDIHLTPTPILASNKKSSLKKPARRPVPNDMTTPEFTRIKKKAKGRPPKYSTQTPEPGKKSPPRRNKPREIVPAVSEPSRRITRSLTKNTSNRINHSLPLSSSAQRSSFRKKHPPQHLNDSLVF